MSLPAALCGICILTAVFLGCSGFGFSGSPKVDLDQYVSLDAYGYDGYGSASIYIDWNRIAEDCGKEESQETEYTSCRTMWATDDINVRETPTMDEDNIVYAIYKGESVTVVGETPNWYKISIPYTDDNGESKEFIGFVSKQYLSDSEPSGTAVQSETAAAESADEEAEPADGAEKQADSGTESTVQPADTEVPASVASFMEQESVTAGTETVPLKGKAFRWTASSGEDAWEVMVYPDVEEGSELYEAVKENGAVPAGKDAYVFLVEGGQAVSAVKMEAGADGANGAVGYLNSGYYFQFYTQSGTENREGQRIFQLREGKMVQVTDLSWSTDLVTGMFTWDPHGEVVVNCDPRIDGREVTLAEFVQASVKYRGYPKLAGKDSSDGSLVIGFDPNGGEGETKFILLSLEEVSIYLPDCPFTKDGAEFAKWGLGKDNSLLIQAGSRVDMKTMQSYSENGVVTWYAIWQ